MYCEVPHRVVKEWAIQSRSMMDRPCKESFCELLRIE